MSERTITVGGGDGRGVSDALGFVLVFAIITSTVAVVYTTGFQDLLSARQYERMNNAERAFDVLADNVEDMTRRGAPSRATEVKLDDARIRPGAPISVNVTVYRNGDHSKNESFQYDVHPIVFEASNEDSVVYEMGAAFRQTSGQTVMTHRPGIVMESDRLVFPVVQTRPLANKSIGGTATVLVRTELSTSSVLVANRTTTSDVTVNVSSPRAEAWRDYFTRNSEATCDDPVNTETFASCEFQAVERVYVTRVAIDFEFVP